MKGIAIVAPNPDQGMLQIAWDHHNSNSTSCVVSWKGYGVLFKRLISALNNMTEDVWTTGFGTGRTHESPAPLPEFNPEEDMLTSL